MMNVEQGHGHVRPRRDGVKARCGGPRICPVCAREQAQLMTSPPRASDIEIMQAQTRRIEQLRAENQRLTELLRSEGANRYWEGRWRDADAELMRLHLDSHPV